MRLVFANRVVDSLGDPDVAHRALEVSLCLSKRGQPFAQIEGGRPRSDLGRLLDQGLQPSRHLLASTWIGLLHGGGGLCRHHAAPHRERELFGAGDDPVGKRMSLLVSALSKAEPASDRIDPGPEVRTITGRQVAGRLVESRFGVFQPRHLTPTARHVDENDRTTCRRYDRSVLSQGVRERVVLGSGLFQPARGTQHARHVGPGEQCLFRGEVRKGEGALKPPPGQRELAGAVEERSRREKDLRLDRRIIAELSLFFRPTHRRQRAAKVSECGIGARDVRQRYAGNGMSPRGVRVLLEVGENLDAELPYLARLARLPTSQIELPFEQLLENGLEISR